MKRMKIALVLLPIVLLLAACAGTPKKNESRLGGRRCLDTQGSCQKLEPRATSSSSEQVPDTVSSSYSAASTASAGEPLVTVHLDSLQILGNLEEYTVIQNSLRKLFKYRSPALRAIYKEHLSKDPSLQGKIWISFGVQGEGEIGKVKATGSTTGNPIFDAQIAQKIESWKKTGQPVQKNTLVMLPLEFTLVGE